jgi:two-component system NarL family sensor kinase
METPMSEFTMMFSVATIGMLVLAMAIVFFVHFYQRRMLENKLKQQSLEAEYQQKMLLAALESQENERQRLAGDLHDSIGAMLSAIRISMLTAARSENANADGFQQVKVMIDETIDSVRRISRDLMPSTLQKFGLGQAIREICDQYASASGIKIEFSQQGEEQPLEKSAQIMLFRIIQELLNNSMKHSKASHITVSVRWSELLTIVVEDNGIGFNFEELKLSAKGLGLFNMQNRAKMLGGNLQYESNRTNGTLASVAIPIV